MKEWFLGKEYRKNLLMIKQTKLFVLKTSLLIKPQKVSTFYNYLALQG